MFGDLESWDFDMNFSLFVFFSDAAMASLISLRGNYL